MGTKLKPELSEKNPYWISRHRFYELKHFCLQYPIWKIAYNQLASNSVNSSSLYSVPDGNAEPADHTNRIGISMAGYAARMGMVEEAASRTDDYMRNYILIAVTQGLSYETMKTRYDIPCSRDSYYDLYRKFFWILHTLRD